MATKRKKAKKTVGTSPKVPAASAATLLGTLIVAFLVERVDTSFDVSTEQAIFGGLVAAVLAAAGAYLGKPGDVEVDD